MFSQSKGLRFNREAAISSICGTIDDGIFVADIFENQKIEPPLFHYIITRHGSTEIVDWGQGFSMEAMRTAAENWIARYTRAAS